MERAPNIETKRCSHCKEHKPLSEYGSNRSKSDGLQDRCKVCCREASKKSYLKRLSRQQQLKRVIARTPPHIIEMIYSRATDYKERKKKRG